MSGPASAGLWAVFLLGLTGGFGHCLAMCGPLVSAASLAQACGGAACAPGQPSEVAGGGGGRTSPMRFQFAYHLGRLGTYAVIGAVLGLLGQAQALLTLQSTFSPDAVTRWLKLGTGLALVAVGGVLLVSALRNVGVRIPEPTRLITETRWFSASTQKLLGRGDRSGFWLGALMGLLPCMPLLPVELVALSSGYPLYGMLIMISFGLGTIPALAGFGAAAGLLGRRARGGFTVASGALVVVLGLVIAWQGVGFATSL